PAARGCRDHRHDRLNRPAGAAAERGGMMETPGIDGLESEEQARPHRHTDLVALASGWDLWHTPDGTAYTTIPVVDHREHHPLRSRSVRGALARAAYAATGRPARGEARSEALDVLEGRALYEGAEHAVHVRLAEHAGAVYLDLGDAAWRAVEVTEAN